MFWIFDFSLHHGAKELMASTSGVAKKGSARYHCLPCTSGTKNEHVAHFESRFKAVSRVGHPLHRPDCLDRGET